MRLEGKLKDRQEMLAECVAEGWDTGSLEKEMASLQASLEGYRAKVIALYLKQL